MCNNYLTFTAEGQDFEHTSQPLLFFPGPSGAKECANISIIDDQILEGDEMFNVVINSSDISVGISPSIAAIIILDEDSEFIFIGTTSDGSILQPASL